MRRRVLAVRFGVACTLALENFDVRCFCGFNSQKCNAPMLRRSSSPLCSFFCQMSRLDGVYRYHGSCTAVLRQSWAMNPKRQWMCSNDSCRKINSEFRISCEVCGTGKPNFLGWKCVKCQVKNHGGVKKCKSCGESFEASKEFWLCAACGENNRVDELDDNSRCGYCSYDMAPLSLTQEKAEEILQMRAQEIQRRQENFDSISAQDAEEQFGDVASGHEALPAELKSPAYSAGALNVKALPMEEIKPFKPRPIETAHSRLFRKPNPLSAVVEGGIPPGPPGFDWMCRGPTCGHINPGDEESCMKCGQHITPSEWECPHCAALNHLSRSRCFSCHSPIPMHWACEQCRTLTSIYDKACRQCEAPRPPVSPRSPHEVQHDRRSGRSTPKGGANSPERSDWYCETCGCMNFARRQECFQCKAARPTLAGVPFEMGSETAPGGAASGGSVTSHQNWSCPSCRTANFRTRSACWKCGGPPPSMVAWKVESHTPHFQQEGFLKGETDDRPVEGAMNVWKKTDNWICAKCFASNFRSKNDCYKCGSPKSVAVAPRRAAVRKPVKL